MYNYDMSDYMNSSDKSLRFSIYDKNALKNISRVCKALSVPDRLRIMSILSNGPMNLYELAVNLALPISSVSYHINVLQEAGLVLTTFKPTPKGHARVCSKAVLATVISFEDAQPPANSADSFEMPIGLFTDCRVEAPCGMLSAVGRLGFVDDPASFFLPSRAEAELLWFNSGYVTYYMPAPDPAKKVIDLSFSFEVCSETAYYNTNWKSDITVHINDREIITFTSPGDFGGRRGNYTPQFWPLTSTQFGLLKVLEIDDGGVKLDSVRQRTNITLADLGIGEGNYIKFTLEIKEDAEHKGGLNLFGKHFGDHAQAIVMTVLYDNAPVPGGRTH